MPCATTLRAVPRRRETPYEAAIPLRPMGYGGVGPSPALPLLPDTHGIASSHRLGSVGAPAAGGSGARNVARRTSSTAF